MEELKNVKISELTPEQIKSRKEFLLTLTKEEVMDYLLYIMDEEYVLGDQSKENIKVQDFLADERFNKFRDLIVKELDIDLSKTEIETKKVSSAPRKLRKKNKKIREKEKTEKKKNEN
jgi:hypothetical protein